MKAHGLGFRVLEFRVQGSGFQGLGFGVPHLEVEALISLMLVEALVALMLPCGLVSNIVVRVEGFYTVEDP